MIRQLCSRLISLAVVALPFSVVARIFAVHELAIVNHMTLERVRDWFAVEPFGTYYIRFICFGVPFIIAVEGVAALIRMLWPSRTREI